MRLAQVDYKAIQTLPLTDFPLLQRHLAKRKDLQLYQDFPEMLTYFLLVEESLVRGVTGAEFCLYDTKNFLYISPFEIAKGFRKLGLGRTLLQKLVKYAQDNRLGGLCLFCRKEVLSFYLKHGFQEVYTVDKGEDLLYFLVYDLQEEKVSNG